MVSLYFLQDYDFYKKGKIFKVPYQRAKDLIRSKIAIEYDQR